MIRLRAWMPILLLCSGATCAVPETLPPGFPTRRGALVFCSASTLADASPSPDTLAWLSQFDVIITNGHSLLRPATGDFLRARGARVLWYFWTNGFTARELDYTLPDGRWRNDLLAGHPEWLLSTEPLEGPPGTPPSYYYDFAQPALVEFLAGHLAIFLRAHGYGGIFLDYAGVYALPTVVAARWQERYPDLPYDRALLAFLRRLRQVQRELVICTNQAYRSVEPLLAEVDYDLTESSATSYAWRPAVEVMGQCLTETFFRPWSGPGGLGELCGGIEERLRAVPPCRGFIYLDYMRPRYRREGETVAPQLDLEAVYYSYCAAALWGRNSFCSGWHAGREYQGPLYFADLGQPLGNGPHDLGGVVVREYERGLVALTTAAKTAEVTCTLAAPAGAALYDLFSGVELPIIGNAVRLRLDPSHSELDGQPNPTGRVYLK